MADRERTVAATDVRRKGSTQGFGQLHMEINVNEIGKERKKRRKKKRRRNPVIVKDRILCGR